MRAKKTIAVMLSVLLMLAQAVSALAEQPTPAEAAFTPVETSTDVTIIWDGLPGLGDEFNNIVRSLTDSVAISGRTANTAEGQGYGEFTLALQGESAFTFQYVQDEDAYYCVSDLLPEPIVIHTADMENFMNNLSAALSGNLEMADGGLNEEIPLNLPSVAGVEPFTFDFGGVEAQLKTPEMVAFQENLAAKIPEIFAGEAVAALPDSIVSDAVAGGTVYSLTPDKASALWAEIKPLFTEYDAYWQEIYRMMEPMLAQIAESEGQTLQSIDEMVAQIRTLADQEPTLPEGLTAYYADGVDADSAPLTSLLSIQVPATETSNALAMHIEWVSQMQLFYLGLMDGDTIVELPILFAKEEPVVEDGFTVTRGAVSAELSVTSGEADAQTITFDTAYAYGEKDGETIHSADIRIAGTMLDSVTGGVGIGIAPECTQINYDGSIDTKTTVEFYLFSGEEQHPVFSVDTLSKESAPTTAPFDIASDILFFDVGALDQAGFDAWINEQFSMSLMQALLKVASMVPEEVLASVLSVDGGTAIESVEVVEIEATPATPSGTGK